MRVDYRKALTEEKLKLVDELHGLSGNDMEEMVEKLNYGCTVMSLNAYLFKKGYGSDSGGPFADTVFDRLSKFSYEMNNGDKYAELTLYAFDGDVFDGKLHIFHTYEDHDYEEELVGFDSTNDLFNTIQLYVLDEIRHLI